MIVDADKQIMGRLSSSVASIILKGEEVKIINCEKAVISGRPENTVNKYLKKKEIGDPRHGPHTSLRPENILRDSIKGMLPKRKKRGKEALRKLEIVRGNPDGEEGEKIAKGTDKLTTNYITVGELSQRIGGK